MLTLAAAETLSGVAGTATAITYSLFGMELNAGVEAYKQLAQGQLGTSAGTIYTTPASTQTFVKSIHLANTTAAPVSGVKLFKVGAAAGNQITGSITIPANGWATCEEDGWRVYNANGQLLQDKMPTLNVFSRATWTFSTTTTSADPGAGFARASVATTLDATTNFNLYISKFDKNGVDQSALFSCLSATDHKLQSTVNILASISSLTGTLAIVTSITDNGSWITLACKVLHTVLNGLPANNTDVVFQFESNARVIQGLSTPPILSGKYLYGVPGFQAHYALAQGLPTGTAAILFVPFFTDVAIRVRSIMMNVQTAPTTGTDVKFGIYRMNTNVGNPSRLGEKIVEFTNQVSFIATTGLKTFTASQDLEPGLYWLAVAFKSMTGSPAMTALHGLYDRAANINASVATYTIATRWRIFGTDYTATTMPAEGTALTVDVANLVSSEAAQNYLPAHLEYFQIP